MARSVSAHVASASKTGEHVVGSVPRDLLELGDAVTFRGRHLGLRFTMTSAITAMDRPRHFRDEMRRGPFRRFEHDHYFDVTDDGRTRMRDDVRFVVPGALLGLPIGRWVLVPHLRVFLSERAGHLKRLAEGAG